MYPRCYSDVFYLLLTLFSIHSVLADYKCICNYKIERGVYTSASKQGDPIGYLYEFDCKPIISLTSQSGDWAVIAFEHQRGFVFKDQQTRVEVCPGEPASTDLLASTSSTASSLKSTVANAISHTTTFTMFPSSQTTDTRTTIVKTTQTSTMRTTTAGVWMCPPIVQQSSRQESSSLFINYDDRKCYEMKTHLRNWEYAENDCKLKGGNLATVGDSLDENLIYKFVRTYGHATWIGLNDRNKEESFEWASGEPVVYLNWHSGRKDAYLHVTEDCVAIGPHTGTWEDMDCLHKYAYICEYDAVFGSSNGTNVLTTSEAYTEGNTRTCPSSVKSMALKDSSILGQYKKNCYELISDIRIRWEHGESMCRNRGGHLAHISNADEQGFIEYFINQHSPQHAVWIGLNDTTNEGHFEWTSGTMLSYTNWVPEHEDNFGSHNTEDCVVFIPYKNGQWDDVTCGDFGEVYPVLCQYDIATSPVVG